MSPWIETLLALQNTDLHIRALKMRQSLIPKEKMQIKERFDSELLGVKSVKEELAKLELELKSNQSVVEKHQEHVKKLQQQASSIKKNDEYQAMLKEIAAVKETISGLETTEIELFDAIEEKQKTLAAATRDVQARTANLKEEFEELVETEKEIAEELEKSIAQRNLQSKRVEPSILSRYNQLLSRGEGTPLAKVDNGICGNCHMRLTPQTNTHAKKGAEAYCDSCMHLVYIEQ